MRGGQEVSDNAINLALIAEASLRQGGVAQRDQECFDESAGWNESRQRDIEAAGSHSREVRPR